MKLTQSINFKWNPFILRGEAPASLRYKANEEELEFATKEELEAIKADPKLEKVHKAMLAGVTKKFQERAAEVQTLRQTVESLQSERDDLDGRLTKWEQWYQPNEARIKAAFENPEGGGKSKRKVKTDGEGEDEKDDRIQQLIETINKGASEYEKRLDHLGKMLNYQMQLNELYRKNPQLDANKVLDIALKKGYTDLNKAYEDKEAYGEEIFNKEVDKRLEPRLKEEMAKRTTNVETGSGAQALKFELPKELPKSFTDASSQALADLHTAREKEAAKP